MRGSPLVPLVVLTLLAGCFGKGGEDAPSPSPLATTGNGTATDATLPDGRGQSAGNLEANKTEEGRFGEEHKHDYWMNREQVVVFQDDVSFIPLPLTPDGQGTMPKGVVYFKPRNDTQVFEGTGRVTLVAQAPGVAGHQNPAGPALTLQYRTAADAGWRAPIALSYGQPVEMKVQPRETDMPHSTASLWAFRITTDRLDYLESVNVTVTAHRAGEVVDWPGHPDFYADKTERVLLDKEVKTHKAGFNEAILYENVDSWVHTEKLISYGTERIEAWVNITRIDVTGNQQPIAYVLSYHNATKLDEDFDNFDNVGDAEGKNDLKSYHFVLKVDPAGMDGPYQPASRWGFRLDAAFGTPGVADVPAFGFTDATSYDVTYHIKIVAYAGKDAGAIAG